MEDTVEENPKGQDLPDVEIHNLIVEFLNSSKLLEYKKIKEVNEVLVFNLPTGEQILFSDFLEKQKLKDALNSGALSENDISEDILHMFFTTEDADRLEELNKKINGFKLILKKRIKGTEQYKKDLSILEKLEEEQNQLITKKHIINQFTAEYIAREEKLLYLLTQCSTDTAKKRIWASSEELLSSITIRNIYELLNNFILFYYGPDITVIRKIARSPEWRNLYVAATKLNTNIFNREIKDLSIAQLQLLIWSIFYQNIYELPSGDKPPADIIEDDEKIDEYMSRLYKKISAEDSIKYKKNNSIKGKISASEHDHVIISAESKNYITFNREKLFSDTDLITGRTENKSELNEAKERLDIKKKIKLRNK